MGIFASLIDKVSRGAARVGYALGVVGKIDVGESIGVFRGSASFEGKSRGKVLSEMYSDFDETIKLKEQLVSMPRDNIDSFELSYAKITYQPAISYFDRAKEVLDDRRLKNFKRNLELTIQEYISGSWRNADFYELNSGSTGFIRSSIKEDNVKETINYYAMKLIGMNGADSKLLELASSITGVAYSSKIAN